MRIVSRLKKAVKRHISSAVHVENAENRQNMGGGGLIENLSPDLCKINIDMRLPPADRKYARIGQNSAVCATFIYESQCGFVDIGDNVYIGKATFICRTGIKIDSNVLVAWDVTFYDHDSHSFDYKKRRNDISFVVNDLKIGRAIAADVDWSVVHTEPIHVCHDAWIGANCTILNGVTIGEGAIIGNGSVVREDIPAWAIAYGNPCKVMGYNRYQE